MLMTAWGRIWNVKACNALHRTSFIHILTVAQKREEEMRVHLRLGAGKTARRVKKLAVDLSLIPVTRMLEERVSSSLQIVLLPPHMTQTHAQANTWISGIRNIFN